MQRHTILAAVIAALICSAGATAGAATPQEVEQAIAKAKAFLYSAQQGGNWEPPRNDPPDKSHWVGGVTAAATYALLSAGEKPDNPKLQKAIAFLGRTEIKGTYALGLRCQIYQFLPLGPNKGLIRNDAMALLGAIHADGVAPGKAFFSYWIDQKVWVDLSNSQYGVLGLWGLAETGLEIPTQQWAEIDARWRAHQNPDGSWSYHWPAEANDMGSHTMTAAGIATLFITSDFLHGMDGLDCKGNVVDKEIEKGLEWMNQHFKKYGTAGMRSFYFLYGVERIGVASGRKYFGDFDWYARGADVLVHSQKPDGSWQGEYSGEYGPAIDTSYALLFLVRGRAPVIMNKLQYDIDTHGDKAVVANWNQRPRDVAHFAKWVGKQNETLLNWQVVDLHAPEDLHDAPLLYLAGNQTLSFTDVQEGRLRAFVEQGGIIVGNADCGNPSFASSFMKLGGKLFPDYEFSLLPATHVLFTEQFPADKWKTKPAVKVLSNGARLLMVLLPTGDPARYWQASAVAGHEEAWQFMDDLFLYAVDRTNLRTKGSGYIVIADPKEKATTTIKLARLQYSGNWNPEPGGWRRLAAVMHNQDHTDLAFEPVKLGAGKLTKDYKIAHLTGTAAFTLDATAREELKHFVESGGTLVIDAAGGSGEFYDSAVKQLAEIFPGSKPRTLPATHAIFSAPQAIDAVSYRRFAQKTLGHGHTPRLQGLEIAGRTAVILSDIDLSVGLVGQEVDGIMGYSPASATELMRNIVCFANAPAKAATGPASAPTK